MNKSEEKRKLLEFFEQYITENKQQKIAETLSNRTRHITVVLEDLYQPHNASAVVRSCDCFGIQDLHVIENEHQFSASKKVVRGSSKWVDVIRHAQYQQNTPACFEHLREKGYKLYGTSPHRNDVELADLPVTDEKIALIFGTEYTGLSDFALENADGFVRIPMYGFTESYNISVSAALCLYDLTHKMRSSAVNWQLSEEERNELKLRWYKQLIRNSDAMERMFLTQLKS